MRKEHINAQLARFQAWIRWFNAQKNFKQKQEEYDNILYLQRAIRQNITLINWPWYHLYLKIREIIPMVLDQRNLAKLKIENSDLQKVRIFFIIILGNFKSIFD